MVLEKALEQRIESLQIKEREESAIMQFLEEIKAYHKPTYNHCVRVGLKSAEAAARTGCNIEHMLIAGLLHDIGKLVIDVSLLDKKSGFNDEDYHIMHSHPAAGYLLAKSSFPFAAEVILRRHTREKMPYPVSFPKIKRGISKSSVEKHANLLSIIDFYDAMRTRKDHFPYDCSSRKQRLLEGRKGMEGAINSLYDSGILK